MTWWSRIQSVHELGWLYFNFVNYNPLKAIAFKDPLIDRKGGLPVVKEINNTVITKL